MKLKKFYYRLKKVFVKNICAECGKKMISKKHNICYECNRPNEIEGYKKIYGK